MYLCYISSLLRSRFWGCHATLSPSPKTAAKEIPQKQPTDLFFGKQLDADLSFTTQCIGFLFYAYLKTK